MPEPHDMPGLTPAFSRLAWSNLAAQSAEQLSLAAAPIVAVLAFNAGPGEAGALQTIQTLPFLLLAIPAGVLVDRMARSRLMAGAEALRVLSFLAILALTLLGALTIPLLAVLGFIGACGTVVYSVAAPALVPALVGRELLPVANGRIELARTAAFAGGPALGGLLIGSVGVSPAFGAAAALSTLAVVLLAGLSEPPRPPAAKRHPFRDVREGAVFVFRHALLRPVFVTQFVFNIAFFVLQAVYVPYAINELGLTAWTVGLTLTCYGIGMVLGALLAARVMARFPFGVSVVLGPVVGFIASLVMVATIAVPSVYLAGLSFFLMGAGPIVWVVSTTTLRQSVTPAELLGRVSAINIAAYGARPIGAGIGAFVGGLYGAKACLVIAALGFLAQVLIVCLSPLAHLRTQPS